mgnify:CR=1 FL=1
MGSIDIGPTYLGKGEMATAPESTRRDLTAARAARADAIEAEKAAATTHYAALQACIHLQNLATLAGMTEAERAILAGPCPQGDDAAPWVTRGLALRLSDMGRSYWRWTGKAQDLRAALRV